jgi:hypothetical protein
MLRGTTELYGFGEYSTKTDLGSLLYLILGIQEYGGIYSTERDI